MVEDQQTKVDAIINEYMPLHERYQLETDPEVKAELKRRMQIIELSKSIRTEWF